MLKIITRGNSLVVQWLERCAFTAGGLGSIPGWRTKILQAVQSGWGWGWRMGAKSTYNGLPSLTNSRHVTYTPFLSALLLASPPCLPAQTTLASYSSSTILCLLLPQGLRPRCFLCLKCPSLLPPNSSTFLCDSFKI